MECYAFRIGAAKAAIPYPEDFFPYRSFHSRYLTGVHDDLYVRVIYIKAPGEILFVSIENGDIDPSWVEKLAEEVYVPYQHIFLSATHTHTAPYIGSYWPEAVYDMEKSAAYTAYAWQTVVGTVKEAMGHVEAARMQFSCGSCQVNVNRDVVSVDPSSNRLTYTTGQNFHGYSDKTVQSILFSRKDGTPLAILFNYAVHSSILFGTKLKDNGQMASGDLAGFAMRQVESVFGSDCVSIFTMAPAADQGPRYSGCWTYQDKIGQRQRTDFGMGSFALVASLGGELANEVIHLCALQAGEQMLPDVRSAANILWIPGKVKKEGPDIPRPKSPAEYEASDPVPLPVTLAKVGDVLVVGVGCEITSQIGIDIQNALHNIGYKNIFIITQCNGSSSYMSDDEGYEKVTFAAAASHMMPGASTHLVEGILRLAEKVQ